MQNQVHMLDSEFERSKNVKAGSYTIGITVALLMLFIMYKFPMGGFSQPVVEEGLEVNLGNSDAGSGDDQPMDPGSPAPNEQQYTPPTPVNQPEEEVKDISTDDKDAEAPEIKKPPVVKPKPEATKVPEKEAVKAKPIKNPTPTPAPPSPPKPKAVFGGINGNGTGGNEADSYKKGSGEGIAGGKGDQGRPGGDPDSKNYTGGGRGSGGISISRGLQGRGIVRVPSFQDEFNENAKVAVDITVDASGNVVSVSFQPKGSTTSDPSYKNIALAKARQVKFNAGTQESTGTIIFNFKLKN